MLFQPAGAVQSPLQAAYRENVDPATAAGKPAAICCARYKNRCGFRCRTRHASTELTGRAAINDCASAAGAGHPDDPLRYTAARPLAVLVAANQAKPLPFPQPPRPAMLHARVITTDKEIMAATDD